MCPPFLPALLNSPNKIVLAFLNLTCIIYGKTITKSGQSRKPRPLTKLPAAPRPPHRSPTSADARSQRWQARCRWRSLWAVAERSISVTGTRGSWLEGAESGERVWGGGSGAAAAPSRREPRPRGVTVKVPGSGVRSPGTPRSPPGSQAPRDRFMPPTGLEPARMNRKKGDKGFESPRPYKL